MTMTRKPTLQTRPVVPEQSFDHRSLYLESLLCFAIRKRVLVKLQLKEYITQRLFEPTVVYLSRTRQHCVTGIQIADPEKPLLNLEIRHFEIDSVRNVVLTDQVFIVDPVIDRFDGRYANGIILSTS